MSWTGRITAPPPRIEVMYRGIPVAELSRGRDGKYTFQYLPAFIEMKLAPLPGLPSGRDHVSYDLFPFFQERIPELCRPEILEWLRHHPVREDDKLELLGALAKRSVTDSYELRSKVAA